MEEQLVAALADGGYAVVGPAVASNLRNVIFGFSDRSKRQVVGADSEGSVAYR